MDFIYHTPGSHREMTMILKSGGRTKPQPHIAPAEQFAEAEAMQAITKAVKG
jgi:hypothetical protein